MVQSERIVFDEEFALPNIPILCVQHQGIDIQHDGKTNHFVRIYFKVQENKSAKLYLLNTEEFESYAIKANTVSSSLEPKQFQLCSEKTNEFKSQDIPIHKNCRLHFLFAKSSPFKVPLHFTVREFWNPDPKIMYVYPGIPITNNQLSKKIRSMILESQNNLKILSPHTDLHVIEDITSAINRGIEVKLIIRNSGKNQTQSTSQAFPHLQRLLKKNLKSNDNIHARILIKDDSEALVMSSDLSQDSMQNLINCGIHVSDSTSISNLISFFDEIWNSSKNTI
ncbi:phospholipase D-like domain-containing protein [bacterium]|nr:phospholipase D-like domain-containing protein [bacterium]